MSLYMYLSIHNIMYVSEYSYCYSYLYFFSQYKIPKSSLCSEVNTKKTRNRRKKNEKNRQKNARKKKKRKKNASTNATRTYRQVSATELKVVFITLRTVPLTNFEVWSSAKDPTRELWKKR